MIDNTLNNYGRENWVGHGPYYGQPMQPMCGYRVVGGETNNYVLHGPCCGQCTQPTKVGG